MRRLRALLAIGMLATLGTCGDSGPSGPGALQLRLTSPNTDDGGVMFVVRGGPVDSVRPATGTVFASRLSQTEWRVIVAGNVSGAAIARLWVPDLGARAQYTATIEQVASTAFAQRSTGAYTATIEVP